MRIRRYGDSALRRKAVPIKEVTERHRRILSEMSRLMYDAQGVGLAAPQVGVNASMIVADIGTGLYKLINPRVVSRSGSQVNVEGCLSVPGICVKVKRSRCVRVKALDEQGKTLTIDAEDLLACVLQHEIDHLKGKVIVDYASLFEKMKMKKTLEKLKKEARGYDGVSEPEKKSCDLQL